jgi:hypothetical protein
MALDLGAILTREALLPLRDASGCLAVRRVKEALLEITVDQLRAALRRGVTESARIVGVRPAEVESMLPMGEIEALLHQLSVHQPKALEVWNLHADRLGGFLAGIVDVTMEKGLPEAGWYIGRLAQKVSRDKPLALPLAELAADLDAYQTLLKRAGASVDAGGVLRRAYRMKQLRRALILISAVIAASVWLVLWVRLRQSRARVQAIVDAPDPCIAGAVADADLAHATPAQKSALDAKGHACAEARAAAAHVAACDALVAHVESGALTGEDAALAKDAGPLLGRIAKGSLEAADLALDPVFPCADVASSKRLWPAFKKAAAASTEAWQAADHASPKLVAALKTEGPPMAPEALEVLSTRAEDAAHKGLVTGDEATIQSAVAACRLEDDLGLEPGPSCARLSMILANRGK